MNMKEIKEVLQLMADHDLAEFEMDKDNFKIKLKKMGGKVIQEAYPAVQVHSMPAPVHHAAPAAAQPVKAAAQSAGQGAIDGILVKSPMVGTYYASPAPDQPPYATVGSKIKEGDVLCIIEAMKLMNEIKSEVSGEILEILVKNGQPIEFDQPLFRIKQ